MWAGRTLKLFSGLGKYRMSTACYCQGKTTSTEFRKYGYFPFAARIALSIASSVLKSMADLCKLSERFFRHCPLAFGETIKRARVEPRRMHTTPSACPSYLFAQIAQVQMESAWQKAQELLLRVWETVWRRSSLNLQAGTNGNKAGRPLWHYLECSRRRVNREDELTQPGPVAVGNRDTITS